MRFLDNVLSDFIEKAPDSMAKARYAAMRERSVGLGVMGFHSFLQRQGLPFGSALAKVWNMRMFKQIRGQADAASRKLAEERGACPDAAAFGIMERFSNKLAIAPTASISIFAAAPRRGSNRSPPTLSPTRRCPARSPCATNTSRRCWPKRP